MNSAELYNLSSLRTLVYGAAPIARPRHCQLKRPWYARRVGARQHGLGNSLARLLRCPAQAERRRKKAAFGPLS
jgi:hypothetical protein